MRVAFKIAWRYFFSKSRQTIINRINAIALIVIVVATASLLIVLSAFSGLKDFGLSFSNAFDPDHRVTPVLGKTLTLDSIALNQLHSISEIKDFAPILEEKVFLSFEEKNQVAYLKGVGNDYLKVIPGDSLVAIGEWLVPETNGVVVGYGIASALGLGVYDYSSFLNISIPRNKTKSAFGKSPFQSVSSVVIGLYQISEDLDKKYIFAPMAFAQELLQYPEGVYSAIELKTKPETDFKQLKQKIEKILGKEVVVRDRIQLNAALYKMLNTENLVIYLIFTLVLIIAFFNVVGALIMMILDKKPQMRILVAMGARPKNLRLVFFLLGMLITVIGGLVGITSASILIAIQSAAPFLYVPGTSLPYPVSLEFKNLILVFLTLVLLGSIASSWASRGVGSESLGRN